MRQPNLPVRQHLFYFYTSIETLPLLDRIGQINYDEDLTATPLSKIVRNHSVQVPTLVKEVANDTAQKSTSNYHSKTIEIYLNQYRKNPNISRSERIEQCIFVTDNETVRNEFKAKCGDSTLKRWEDKLDETLEKHERYSGLSG